MVPITHKEIRLPHSQSAIRYLIRKVFGHSGHLPSRSATLKGHITEGNCLWYVSEKLSAA